MKKNDDEKIKRMIKESVRYALYEKNINEDDLEEERIANADARPEVNNKENFVGSHCYGEDIGKQVGKPGELYVVYSYDHPLYIWEKSGEGQKGTWYENMDDYMVDGQPYEFSEKHKKLLRPISGTKGKLGKEIDAIINRYKHNNGIKTLTHTNIPIGEK